MIIEICAPSFKSAQAAQAGGANQIELCQHLSVGGLTPTIQTLEKVLDKLTIPVHVLVRPRDGDFCYSELEVTQMLKTIAHCQKLGCAGIVSGALTRDGAIDPEINRRLISAAKGMEFTFHRAIDICSNWQRGLDFLLSQKITRILSSGQEQKAITGLPRLLQMKRQVKEQIQIMPGGGISLDNGLDFKNAGFEMIHFSATKKTANMSGNGLFNKAVVGHSDQETIEKMARLLA